MQYIKKLCILKQLASGFAADGKKVSALLTAESYGGRLTLALALIGFAPLSAGRYRCLACDEKGQTEAFELTERGGTLKKESALDISAGMCCLVCFVGGKVTPVAFGKCGDKTYDIKRLCALLDEAEAPARAEGQAEKRPPKRALGAKEMRAKPATGAPVESQIRAKPAAGAPVESGIRAKPADGAPEESEAQGPEGAPYDDEVVATQNYYAFDEEESDEESGEGSAAGEGGKGAGEDEDAQSLFRLAGGEGERADAGACYYDQVKGDLDALFGKYPPEEELAGCIPYSRWAKVVFARNKYYTVGVICDEKRPKYICYGVPAERRGEPPAALKGFCSFLPLSVFDLSGKGYWMMFQDAETGQCVRIEEK